MGDVDKQIENMYVMQYRQISTEKLKSIRRTIAFTVKMIEMVLKEREHTQQKDVVISD